MNRFMQLISDVARVKKNKQWGSLSEDTPVCQYVSISMIQNVLLIWLDSNIDEEHDEDWRNTIAQLHSVINRIKTFTNSDQCITFLSEINDEKVCMITSGSLGQSIVPKIHTMSQMDSIFIFCGNKPYHEQWAKEWPKIKGVYTEIIPINEALKQVVQECEHNAFGISFMSTNDDTSKKNLDHHECFFIYTHLLKNILLTIQFDEQHIKEFIDACCKMFANNDTTNLSNIKQLEQKYHDKSPVWWYTKDCFLYSMLNRALRVMDLDIIIKMGFFVRDLHRQIQKLHSEQFGGHHSAQKFVVYRGQGLSKADFEQMMNTKGGLISFNSFLSASKDPEASFTFVRRAVTNPDLIGVLFVMTVDVNKSSIPFALINSVSSLQQQADEVLFSMYAVFRIREIKQMDGHNRLWQAELTLTSDNDQDLCTLTKTIQEETEETNEWFQFGQLLITMGQPDKAQQLYELMLKQSYNENDKANILHQLGWALRAQGNYKEALSVYKNSFNIRQKTLPSNSPGLVKSYGNIGLVYYNMKDYSKALSNYEKVLEINRKSLPSGHPNMIMSYNNIGSVYNAMNDYSKALSYYEKSLGVMKKTLPPHHPDFVDSYNNIAGMYANMKEYLKALSSYEMALDILQKMLSPNHIDLAKFYSNIGLIYYKMGNYVEALTNYEKTLEIQQKSLSPKHPDLAMSYHNIGEVYKKQGEYSKAHSFYEHAVDIGQTSLPSGHSDLKMYKKNLDSVKKKF